MGILSEMYSFRDNLVNSESKLISTGEFALWCALKMFQKEDEESFSVPSWPLEKLTGLSRNGVYKARQKLVEGGLIEYLPETAVNKPGQYRFINNSGKEVFTNFYAKVDTEVNTVSDTKVNNGIEIKELNTEECTQVDTKVSTQQEVSTEVDIEVNTTRYTKENTGAVTGNAFRNAANQFKLQLKRSDMDGCNPS